MQLCDDELVIDPGKWVRTVAPARTDPKWYQIVGLFVMVALAVVGAASIVTKVTDEWAKRNRSVATFEIGPAIPMAIPYNDSLRKNRIITDAVLNKAMDSALAKWRVALGHDVKRPEFLVSDNMGGCDDQSGLIACAQPSTYRIFVKSIFYADPETVLMHEIGHLLGVPHIEGDALMAATYQGKVEKPTKLAVALARAAK